MRRRSLIFGLGVTACLALLALNLDAFLAQPPTVVVTVQVRDTSGGTLFYRWKSSDGAIKNVNAPSTTWTLPNGPGLHFAYVLVGNGLGGFAESRIAVNTDTIGTPAKVPPPRTLAAPAAPAQQGDFYRALVIYGGYGGHSVNSDFNAVYRPGIAAYLQDLISGARYPANSTVLTDLKGEVIVPGVPPGTNYALNCSVDGGLSFGQCADSSIQATEMLPAATSVYINTSDFGNDAVSGKLVLQDGNPCGTVNEFFGIRVAATATLLDAQHNILAGPVQVNEFGDYSLPFDPRAASVRLKCGKAKPLVVNVNGKDLGVTVLPGVSAPIVLSMSATLNGTPVGIFPPPPPKLPSDMLTRADGYLAEKGVDSRMGACQYYKAVGAVKGCGAAGSLIGAISFEDWKRTVKIGKYAVGGVPEYTATYINKMDLNLTREHHSISYGPSQTAAYVCNHLGPPFNLVTPQSDIDTAIDNTVNGKDLVACVAMDYTVTPGVNNGEPFIRFLIFGPSGQLLPSVNLDGRREKFVPGTCVVCHGGDHYAGKFPEDGSGFANVGGHFLPYDTGNFEFSSKAGLTEADQAQAIYFLNQNVLNAGPTVAEQELIAGWYANGPVLDQFYVPKNWQDAQTTVNISSISRFGGVVTVNTSSNNSFVKGLVGIAGVADASYSGTFLSYSSSPTRFFYFQAGVDSASSGGTATLNPNAADFYQNVVARSCRSCHVAMVERYNFDHFQNIAPYTVTDGLADTGFDVGINVCGGSGQIERDHMMPNSLVTFNRLWLTYQNTAGLPDQPTILAQFFGSDTGATGTCIPGITP